ncbi:MAG: hypothetical protein M0P22_04545 [Methanoculleus sp.]|nr:hypothetical protein [Methanoculleus sp.]
MHIPIAQLSFEDEETNAVLASGMIAQGPETAAWSIIMPEVASHEFIVCCGVTGTGCIPRTSRKS